jgi:hypothetical protein
MVAAPYERRFSAVTDRRYSQMKTRPGKISVVTRGFFAMLIAPRFRTGTNGLKSVFA